MSKSNALYMDQQEAAFEAFKLEYLKAHPQASDLEAAEQMPESDYREGEE